MSFENRHAFTENNLVIIILPFEITFVVTKIQGNTFFDATSSLSSFHASNSNSPNYRLDLAINLLVFILNIGYSFHSIKGVLSELYYAFVVQVVGNHRVYK